MAYNAQFDLRGKRIEDTYTQVVQYDTSSGISYTGQGQQLSLSSSFSDTALSASWAPSPTFNFDSASWASQSLSSSWSPFVATVSASWASQSLSASYISSSGIVGIVTSSSYASSINTSSFVMISGSQYVAGNKLFNYSNGWLSLSPNIGGGNFGPGSGAPNSTSIDWGVGILFGYDGTIESLDWGARQMFDGHNHTAMAWDYGSRYLYSNINEVDNEVSLDWGNRLLVDLLQTSSLDWNNRILSGSWTTDSSLFINGNVSCSVITASYINTNSSSLAPLNQTTASAWMPIVVNGQMFYVPLYQ